MKSPKSEWQWTLRTRIGFRPVHQQQYRCACCESAGPIPEKHRTLRTPSLPRTRTRHPAGDLSQLAGRISLAGLSELRVVVRMDPCELTPSGSVNPATVPYLTTLWSYQRVLFLYCTPYFPAEATLPLGSFCLACLSSGHCALSLNNISREIPLPYLLRLLSCLLLTCFMA